MIAETKVFSTQTLQMDCEKETEKITSFLRGFVGRKMKKRGIVIAVSGGIDSSVCAALCVRALGPERVLALSLPEKDSAPETAGLSQFIADHLGIELITTDITESLRSVGCYQSRDRAIQTVIPEYNSDYKCKITLPDVMNDDMYRIFSVVVQSPQGHIQKERLSPKAYQEILAASNFKQRIRMMLTYYHADRLNYAVIGTPNRQEYDQGFFVKLGDGSADVKPIAHLYKTQVYQLAEHLALPQSICDRPPTTDTYSMPQSQEEFYFSVPYDKMDLCLYGINHGLSTQEVASAAQLTPQQVQRVYNDIEAKRKATHYLHMPPALIEKVEEIST
jgi:NAD+ synthase